ncbi:MAG: hypothetical protein AVDCRST_MAG76-2616, partial [uncultured Acidimicrobiales bacterium]
GERRPEGAHPRARDRTGRCRRQHRWHRGHQRGDHRGNAGHSGGNDRGNLGRHGGWHHQPHNRHLPGPGRRRLQEL